MRHVHVRGMSIPVGARKHHKIITRFPLSKIQANNPNSPGRLQTPDVCSVRVTLKKMSSGYSSGARREPELVPSLRR